MGGGRWGTAEGWVGVSGWGVRVAAEVLTLDTGVEKAKVPFAATTRSFPALFWRMSPVPARPVTVPPTVNFSAVQLTTTEVTLVLATVPDWVGRAPV